MSASREKKARQELNESGYVDPRKAREAAEKAKDRRSTRIYTAVIVAFVLLGVVLFASGRIQASNEAKETARIGAESAVTIDGEDFSVNDVAYYYGSIYNTFANNGSSFGFDSSKSAREQQYTEGKTWHDYFLESALDYMKESVAEFIQTKCIDDLGFARLTMHPRKSMIHCFQYISRKAWDYVQDELKANGVQPGPGQQAYGCDIPDDLCYQWAEDYFRDPDAKEDQGDEEEFVPQPYRGKTSSKSVSKKKKEEKKKEPEKKEPPKKAEADDGQISLGDLSSFGEAA